MDLKIATTKQELNQALFQITHGLYILTAATLAKLNGQCLDALMQVTSMPPRIAIGVAKRNLTHEMIMESGRFTVNLLDKNDPAKMEKVKHFGFQSGRSVDKFASVQYNLGENGVPILEDTKAFFECSVAPEFTLDLGTHTLFVGEVVRAGICEPCEPLTYNEYRKIKTKGG